MIWDDMRNQSVRARYSDAQVIRVPLRLLAYDRDPSTAAIRKMLADGDTTPLETPWAEGSDYQRWLMLLPKRGDGSTDGSWINPPFKRFVVASTHDEPTCILATHSQCDGSRWSLDLDKLVRDDHDGQIFVAESISISCSESGAVSRWYPTDLGRLERDGLLFNRHVELGLEPVRSVRVSLGFKSEEAATEDLHNYMMIVTIATMALLCCQNVSSRIVTPPRQQRRYAERSGRLPPVSWHELIVAPLANSSKTETSGSTSGESIALHWVRGHFKDYRQRGMFGKIRGVYWWSPHLAGRADRVVLKDYRIAEMPK